MLGQVFDVSNPLVHGSGEMISVIQAAQDDAGEVDGLSEVAHQRALDAHHVPPARTNPNNLRSGLRFFKTQISYWTSSGNLTVKRLAQN